MTSGDARTAIDRLSILGGRLRIAFVIPTMTAGGAERVAATLCSRWAGDGHAVSMFTFESPEAVPHYSIDSRVEIHALDLLRTSRNFASFLTQNLWRVARLRRALRALSPDVVVSFMPEPNVVALLAGMGQRWPTVVSERVHPGHLRMAFVPGVMRRLTYPFAAAVVAQTRGIAAYIDRHFHVSSDVIANPIDLAKFRPGPDPAAVDGRRRILSAGRLDPQKGFDVLIDAFARIAADAPDWDLHIFGEGPMRADLATRIAAHGLNGRVRLAGLTGDLASELRRADLYAHAARFEGFPNAVMEALACGCAVVAADSPGGVGELLQGGKFGLLVPVNDAAALASALRRAIFDDALRSDLRQTAPSAVTGLAIERIAEEWLSLFHRLRAGRRYVAEPATSSRA